MPLEKRVNLQDDLGRLARAVKAVPTGKKYVLQLSSDVEYEYEVVRKRKREEAEEEEVGSMRASMLEGTERPAWAGREKEGMRRKLAGSQVGVGIRWARRIFRYMGAGVR